MCALLQGFGNQLTASAAVLAGVIGVHQHHLSPGTCSLGDTQGLELSPASIQNRHVQARLGCCPIGQVGAFPLRVRLGCGRLAHLGDLQVFKDQHAIAVDQRAGGFVLKIVPLVADPSVRCCQRKSRPLASMGPALFAVLGLLQEFDTLQPTAVGAWVLNRFPRRERGKVEEAQVNANGLFTGRQRFLFYLTGKGDIPLIHLPLDGHGFDGPLQRSVYTYLEVTNLGEGEHLPSEGEAGLGIGEQS